MLIDSFSDDWLAELDARALEVKPPNSLYLLIDGAFVEGLHRMLPDDAKVCLFSTQPGANDETLDVSPFLTPYAATTHSLLTRCNRWPMVSVIETPEPVARLAERLAAWCVVAVDRQRFNFRFADTRRLPAIYENLNPMQRVQFSGPASQWAYVARDGLWRSLPIDSQGVEVAREVVLDERQFSNLVEDCEADEMMTALSREELDVYHHPSRSHALVSRAQTLAKQKILDRPELTAWCAWFWKNDQLPGPSIEDWCKNTREA